MNQQTTLFFIPGGPGYNCAPEEKLLLPGLKELFSAPSVLAFADPRDLGALGLKPYLKATREQFLKTREKAQDGKVTIIAHSFGVVNAVHLAEEFPQMIEQLVMISPAQCMHLVDQRIVDLCLKEVIQSDPEFYKILKARPKISTSFGTQDIETLMLVAKNYPFLKHYFFKEKYFKEIIPCYQEQDAFSMETFFSVRKQYVSKSYEQFLNKPKFANSNMSAIKCSLVTGAKDPMINVPLELLILKQYFKNITTAVFTQSAHYTHLEERPLFLKYLAEMCSAKKSEQTFLSKDEQSTLTETTTSNGARPNFKKSSAIHLTWKETSERSLQ